MLETILHYAKTMGPMGEDQEDLLEALCAAAEEELKGKLREGVAPEDCGRAFPLAAAWLARAALCAEEDLPRSWSAGAVSVTSASAGEQADGMRRQALRLMAPYIHDEGFCFWGVRG